jgi:hypothetical protein
LAVPGFLPGGVGLVFALDCRGGFWFARGRDPAPWVGVLSTFGSLSLHIFGLLFLVPAMLAIRLEIALIAACFIATYSYEGCWAGIVLVTLAYGGTWFSRGPVQAWLSDGPAAWPIGSAEQPAN